MSLLFFMMFPFALHNHAHAFQQLAIRGVLRGNIGKSVIHPRAKFCRSALRAQSNCVGNENKNSQLIEQVKRFDINSMSETNFQRMHDQEHSLPVLLTGVFPFDREEWCSQLMEHIGETELEDQLRDAQGSTQLLHGPLPAFIDKVYTSSHNRSWCEIHP